MNNFDVIFDKIDNYLKDKKSSETSILFFLLFVIVGFLSYSYIYPITDAKLKQTSRLAKDMDKKLLDETSYIRSISKDIDEAFVIKKVKQDIETSKLLLEKTTFTNAYVDNKLKELSYLLFNDENWAKFLNSITRLAQEYNIDIKLIENKINEPSIQKIEQILNLKVDFNGHFTNSVKFINALEESELVVDVYELTCLGQKNIECQVNIAVWGMKY
ncbi:MAG: hypothetical protein KBE79_05255 [Sulfurospirillum sp.]|nr:hypothetical protein [Sulfurospirillum sp.]MBP9613519.1 hypothetical protein [Sulfurospirillum sp.]